MIATHYRRNLRAAVAFSAGPYGYTLTLWSTGAVLTGTHGIPTALSAVTVVVGAVLAFATVGASAFGSLKEDSLVPRCSCHAASTQSSFRNSSATPP